MRDIKTYRQNRREHRMAPLSKRLYFLGKNPMELHWQKDEVPVNLLSDDSHFEMELIIPGFKKEELEVQVKNDILTVRGEKRVEAASDLSNYVLREFNLSVFERRFRLAEEISQDRIEAKYENGILTICFFETETENGSTPSKIEVK